MYCHIHVHSGYASTASHAHGGHEYFAVLVRAKSVIYELTKPLS